MIFIYKNVEIYSHPFAKWLWSVEFTKSKNSKFLIFLTKTDNKLDTENFRMIVQVVWKVYKKTIGGRAFLPPYGRTNKVNLLSHFLQFWGK